MPDLASSACASGCSCTGEQPGRKRKLDDILVDKYEAVGADEAILLARNESRKERGRPPTLFVFVSRPPGANNPSEMGACGSGGVGGNVMGGGSRVGIDGRRCGRWGGVGRFGIL